MKLQQQFEKWLKKLNDIGNITDQQMDMIEAAFMAGTNIETYIPDDIQYRVGKWRITSDILTAHAGDLFYLFRYVVVTRCEFMYHSREFHYQGICPLFRKIEKGEQVPEYDMIFTRSPNGSCTLNVKEIK